MSLAQTIGGMWHVEGLLDPVGGATLATALDAVIGAALGREGEARTITQVRADALVDRPAAAWTRESCRRLAGCARTCSSTSPPRPSPASRALRPPS